MPENFQFARRLRCFACVAFFLFSCVARAQEGTIESKVYRFSELPVEKQDTRDRRQVLKGSTTDLSSFEVHLSTVPAGLAPHPPHTHADEEELVIVKEGNLKVTIAGKTTIVGAGSAALAIPGEEHGFENAGTTPVTYYVLKYRSRLPMDLTRAKNAGGSLMVDWNDLAATKTDRGERRNFFERPTSMTGRYEMHVTLLNKGFNSHAPHTHRAEEIVLLIRGQASMQIGDRHERATAGDLVFLGSNVPHALTNTGNGPVEYFAFQW